MFDPETLAYGLLWYIVFLLSTTCHEAAHAWASKLGGDSTAYNAGQVSLSPFPHMRREILGMLIFPWLTYFLNGWMMGWASAPYDPNWAMRNPRRAAWMSLAGPMANFALVLIAVIILKLGLAFGVFAPLASVDFTHIVGAPATAGSGVEGIAVFVSILFSLNLLLGAFNLLPLPPLDGFTAIGLLLPESASHKMRELKMQAGAYQFVGLIIAWRVFDYVFEPVFLAGLRLLY